MPTLIAVCTAVNAIPTAAATPSHIAAAASDIPGPYSAHIADMSPKNPDTTPVIAATAVAVFSCIPNQFSSHAIANNATATISAASGIFMAASAAAIPPVTIAMIPPDAMIAVASPETAATIAAYVAATVAISPSAE